MISRREFLAMGAMPLLAAAEKKPNILFIISDDHHWQCMGAAGNPNVKTPNLDKLAARGVRFTNAVISTSQCAPSRGILLSGRESYQTGLESNGYTTFRKWKGQTVVEQIRKSGYETILVGKWHIDVTPKECGFSQAPLWLKPAATPYLNPQLRRGLEGQDTEVQGHITDLFTTAAVDVLKDRKNPFLLWLAYTAPHTPWSEPPKYMQVFEGRNAQLAPPAHPKPKPGTAAPAVALKGGGKKKAGGFPKQGGRDGAPFDWETYYAVIQHLDEGAGKVIDALEKAGHWENTLVVFMGDNGYLCGSKGLQGKVFAWEESIRVPYVVSGGLVKKPGVSDAPVASVDVPASLLDYAGLKSSHPLSGKSWRAVVNGGTFPRGVSYSSWNDGRVEALYAGISVEPYRVVRGAQFKYIVWESKKEALYDLKQDPTEERDLSQDPANGENLKRMKNTLRARMKETADPALAWLT
jgi:N-acetylglucosamine-6-sulfatase